MILCFITLSKTAAKVQQLFDMCKYGCVKFDVFCKKYYFFTFDICIYAWKAVPLP